MSDEKRASNRRDFLKLAATGAPVAAVAAVAGTDAEAAIEDAAGEGLRNTEHTKKYYDSARF
jgi:hypothetical protein